ncbi:hypothetical protein JCM10213_002950 [Rhodosporidiobolus nylandii]
MPPAGDAESGASSAPAARTPAASTSQWRWVAEYGLYFDGKRYAKPLPSGEWEYADAVQPEPERRKPVSYEDVDDGQADEVEPFRGQEGVPEEQVWPGDEDEEPPDPYAKAPKLRLVVLKRPEPSVLPPAQTVASLDPSEPVSVGRDKSFERRIRLKELAVSKTHCLLFFSLEPDMEDGGFWAITDSGSTHGTWLSSEGVGKMRLSEAKAASVPHRLHHLDTLHVGTTTFSVHIHPSFACSACSVASDSSNLIPLVAAPADSATPSGYQGTKTKEEKEQDRREQMRGLRDRLLKPDGGGKGGKSSKPAASTAAGSPKPAFVDRAAARRQRDAGSATSSLTPKPKPPASSPFFAVPGPAASFSAAPSRASSTPSDPFASDSRGAQLLSKLSGPAPSSVSAAPTSASPAGKGLGTLIQPRTIDHSSAGGGRDARPGLGSGRLVEIEKVSQQSGSGGSGGNGVAGEKRDWREDAREASRKRFREMG